MPLQERIGAEAGILSNLIGKLRQIGRQVGNASIKNGQLTVQIVAAAP